MTEGKKKKLKSLIGFHSANKINNYNREGRKREKRKKSNNLKNKSKHKNNKCFSWVTTVSPFAGSHSPPHLPRMPSNTVLISGPAVGAAQTLIWSYSPVFLPPMSTAIRTSMFSSVGALSDLLYTPQSQSLPSWSCGFNLQHVQLVGRFWVFLTHTAPGSQLWFYVHLCMWIIHWGLLLRLPWRAWVCPCESQVWKWCSCLGCRGSGSTRYQGSWQLEKQEI